MRSNGRDHTVLYGTSLALTLALGLGGCGSESGGSGGGTACTEIGCTDQVLIRPLSPNGTVIATVQGIVTADGKALTVQCVSGGSSSPEVLCLPGGVAIQGKPTTLKIALASGDLASADPEVSPSYQKVQPNGPKCEPTCMQASVDVALGGGLTDVGYDGGNNDGGTYDGGRQADTGKTCGDAKVCCCDMDAVTAPICSDTGAWQCPKGFGLFTGSDCDYGACGGPCNSPCFDAGDSGGGGLDAGSEDAGAPDATPPDSGSTTDAGPKCCTGSEDCPDGHCISGVCYKTAELGKEQCWIDGDCPSDQACEGVITCPCGALCFAADKPGTCKDKPKPGGCCSGNALCGIGLYCAGDVCKALSELGSSECWGDAQCGEGEACEGAQVCPCGSSCFAPDKAGVCKKKAPACSKLDPGSFGACEMVLGYGWDGGKCVTISGCSCGNSCDAIYKSMDDCNKACGG
ncbi:MAG: hypothetical protein H6747_06810 [Deltaproteobacteria bacterium]|nr:hypothetical protein [Deltaproteobacteria bacterium]